MSRALLLSAALCVLLAVHVHAKIETLTVDHDARRLFHIESFGFEANGHFTLNVKAFQVWYDSSQKTDKDEYNMAFVLQRSATDEGLRVEQSGLPDDKCFHELPEQEEGRVVYTMKKEFWGGKIFERDITEPGYYHLYFSNCEQFALAGFSMELTEYNLELDGKTRNFLSAGESPLPSWFFVISVAFTGLAVVWIQFLLRNRSEIRSIHHLMTVVLVLKLASVFFESFEFHYIKTTGTPHGWNIVYYIFSFMKGMMMFTVIVLIGTGWSYMKPFLTERDKQIMLAVIVVQAMVNLAAVVLDELSPGDKDFLTWRDILHLLDMVCCCFILLPIVWSIRHLKDAAEVDGKAARNVVRLKRFRKFYVLVVSYIYFTRIIVFLLGATLPFEWVWLAVVFREAASFVFYGYTGYLFRPQANNPYLELSQEEEDEGGSTKPRLFEMSPP